LRIKFCMDLCCNGLTCENKSLTNYTEESPSEVNGHLASQEIPRLSQNLKVHYHVHKSPPWIPILSQMNPAHNFPPYFSKIHYNITLPSMTRYPKWFLSFRFSDQHFVCISHHFHRCYTPYPSHAPWLDHPNKIWWSVQVMKLIIMQSSPVFCHIISFRSILLSTPFSYKFSLCYSLSVRQQVSHPYKTTGKITVVYIHLGKRWEDKVF